VKRYKKKKKKLKRKKNWSYKQSRRGLASAGIVIGPSRSESLDDWWCAFPYPP
jgi:hypothetical protein